jgi:hypothetical protein
VKKKLRFFLPDHGETIEDADEYEVDQFGDSDDLVWAATQYAEYYHDNRSGYECSWPIDFHVADGDAFLGVVSVDREARPHFYGKVLKTSEAANAKNQG